MRSSFLDLRRLRYIVAVSEHGSLSAAARALNVAQPALSYHLADLERQVGGLLFDRLPNGMMPTTLGLVFLEHARTILSITAAAETDILRQARGAATTRAVRLGLIPSLASNLVPDLIEAFRVRLPDTQLQIIEARSAFAREMVENGRIDAAITLVDPLERMPALAWENLYGIMRAEKGGDIPFAELLASPLILPSRDNPLREFLELAAREAGLALNVTLEIDGFEPRKRVVRAGLGTTVIGARSIASEKLEDDLVARRIVEPTLRRPIMMTFRRGLDDALRQSVRSVVADVLNG